VTRYKVPLTASTLATVAVVPVTAKSVASTPVTVPLKVTSNCTESALVRALAPLVRTMLLTVGPALTVKFRVSLSVPLFPSSVATVTEAAPVWLAVGVKVRLARAVLASAIDPENEILPDPLPVSPVRPVVVPRVAVPPTAVMVTV